ncbi:PREDICTED: uncharacterized protein LOC108564702 [Nicrophorus vespilloides]|uniref:Uncharacterized protein LOC108564702 n=1 Tax=Nicrophorus vespilloides TaxID=110193 RepID=A0ABM1MXJ1_NICVS|nr:PREDICTED: uncharacterized protein LOC108564702 [Nicrophorus vespilloides]
MPIELLVVLVLIIVFLISFCSFLQRLRRHYESEIHSNRASDMESGFTNDGMQVEDIIHQGIYPSTLAPPPAYSEYDLPPKYDEVMRISKETLPKVHGIERH